MNWFSSALASHGVRLTEASPSMLGPDPDWMGDNFNPARAYRSLTGQGDRSLHAVDQDQMFKIAVFMWDQNPVAKRIIEFLIDYTVGEGFTYTAADERVQTVLDAFWKDPKNAWPLKQFPRFGQLYIFGEAIWPVFVRPSDGRVRLGYIDPANVQWVETDPNNAEDRLRVHLKSQGGVEPPPLSIVRLDEEDRSPTFGFLTGAPSAGTNGTFFFTVNNLTNAARGRSDLLCGFDWLDQYDRFLFAQAERANRLADVLWDITAEDMNEDQQKAWIARNPPPTGLSMRIHNEKITWKAVTPDLGAQDVSELARTLRGQIAIPKGIPEGYLFCHSLDTETLTDRGWLPYELITDQDRIATVNPTTGAIEYQHYEKRWQFRYTGPMYRLKNQNYDALVTPNHQLWVRDTRDMDRNTNRQLVKQPFRFASVESLQPRHMQRWMRASARTEGKELLTFQLPDIHRGRWRKHYAPYLIRMDDWLEFLGWFITEGCVRTTRRVDGKVIPHFQARLAQKNPLYVPVIRALLQRLPFSYTESVNKHSGVFSWSISHRPLVVWLHEHCGMLAENKRIPDFISEVSIRQRNLFLSTLLAGDGTANRRFRGGHIFYTTSRVLADQLQALTLATGYSCKVYPVENPGLCSVLTRYDIQWWETEELPFDRDAIRQEPYDGWVYCFTVPNHLFVTRRHGKMLISGNSGAETNRATLENQSEPFLKYLSRRQKEIKGMLQFVLEFVRDQAMLAGTLPRDLSDEQKAITVEASEVSTPDLGRIATTLKDLTSALLVAEQQTYATTAEAAKLWRQVAQEIGVELPPLPEGMGQEAETVEKPEDDEDGLGVPTPLQLTPAAERGRTQERNGNGRQPVRNGRHGR